MKEEIIAEIDDLTAFIEGIIEDIKKDKEKLREIHRDLVTFEVILKKIKKDLAGISKEIEGVKVL